jgi:uncharacterized membrane protein
MAETTEREVTVNKSTSEVYAFWRDFTRFPRFMSHLESVTDKGNGVSHWVAKAPAGKSVAWDAEIANDRPDELIAWRSLPESQIPNSGEVRFKAVPVGRGTEVHVVMRVEPPAGAAGNVVAMLFGDSPDQEVREALRRFKQMIETGEAATTKGQPSGRGDGRDDTQQDDHPAASERRAGTEQ